MTRYGALHSTELVSQGRYDAAVVEATRELGLDPGEPEPLFNRGQALAGLERFEEAVADYERALAMDASASALDLAVLDDELFDALRALALRQREDRGRATATLERYRALLPEGRHLADLAKWIDHVNGIEVLWYRERA